VLSLASPECERTAQNRTELLITNKLVQEVKHHREPWFDMPFTSAMIPASLIAWWTSAPPSPSLALPPQNPFVPSDFEMIEGGACSTVAVAGGHPSLLGLSVGDPDDHKCVRECEKEDPLA
jgi:hypothetical protein